MQCYYFVLTPTFSYCRSGSDHYCWGLVIETNLYSLQSWLRVAFAHRYDTNLRNEGLFSFSYKYIITKVKPFVKRNFKVFILTRVKANRDCFASCPYFLFSLNISILYQARYHLSRKILKYLLLIYLDKRWLLRATTPRQVS